MTKRLLGCFMVALACCAADKVYVDGVAVSDALTPAQIAKVNESASTNDVNAAVAELRDTSHHAITTNLVTTGGSVVISSAHGCMIKIDVQDNVTLRVGDDFNADGVNMFMLAIKANGHEIDMADTNVNYHDNVDVFDDRWAILHFTKAFGDKWTAIQLNPGE